LYKIEILVKNPNFGQKYRNFGKIYKFLNKSHASVIYFSVGASPKILWNYGQAASNTQVAGRILANFIYKLKFHKPKLYVYLVGHSLGSHVCGQAGSWLKAKSNGSFVIDRIDGLDPAGPLFLDEISIRKSKKHKKIKSSEETKNEENSEETNGFFKGFDFQWLIKKLQGSFRTCGMFFF